VKHFSGYQGIIPVVSWEAFQWWKRRHFNNELGRTKAVKRVDLAFRT